MENTNLHASTKTDFPFKLVNRQLLVVSLASITLEISELVVEMKLVHLLPEANIVICPTKLV